MGLVKLNYFKFTFVFPFRFSDYLCLFNQRKQIRK